MLSVLIPVYNFDVVNLIQSLHQQCTDEHINFEILCVDDASSDPTLKSKNKSILSLQNLTYEELADNLGRSKIRTYLAQKAKYEYLLYLDCDSGIDVGFIKKYVQFLKENQPTIVYGGRSYDPTKPTDQKLIFRWKYGIEREQVSAEKRNADPYRSFMTNNFIIKRDVYLSVFSTQGLEGYGYEDSLLAYLLKQKGIRLEHINNAAVHLGLEAAEDFIKKTQNGIKNLYLLIQENKIDCEQVKLYAYFYALKKRKMDGLCLMVLKPFKNRFKDHLVHSSNPNMVYFDLYKLVLLMEEFKHV